MCPYNKWQIRFSKFVNHDSKITMKREKDISKIIGRHIMVASSDEEKEELKRWRSDEKNEIEYQRLKKLIQHRYFKKNEEADPVPINDFFNRARLIQAKKRTLNWWKVAASVAIILSVGSMLSDYFFLFDNTQIELVADSGQRTEAVLPDGTRVWLNNSSKLIYEQHFGRQRNVQLDGEAFFQVAEDVTSPFTVETGGMEVRVTGTQFNVKNYSNDKTVEVALEEGAVKVRSNVGEKISLEPGDFLTMSKETFQFVKQQGDVRNSSAWRDGVMVFNNEDFDNLITRLERWYDIRIDYRQEDFNGIHYSGTIRNLRLDQVFEFVNLTVPIEVEMKPNHIVLHKQKSNK